jgi:hypothetical protein
VLVRTWDCGESETRGEAGGGDQENGTSRNGARRACGSGEAGGGRYTGGEHGGRRKSSTIWTRIAGDLGSSRRGSVTRVDGDAPTATADEQNCS